MLVVGRIYYYLLMPGGSVMRGGPALLSSSANKPREASPQVGRPALPLSCALYLLHTYMAALREKGDRDRERSEPLDTETAIGTEILCRAVKCTGPD